MRWNCLVALCLAGTAAAAPLTGEQLRAKVLDVDTFGLSGAVVDATLVIRDRSGTTRELRFEGKSRRYQGHLSKGLFRFSAPADMAGTSFLQVQQEKVDDERHLYLPELKKSRRIGGAMRGQAFLATDFNYADLDRRDLRDGTAQLDGEETLGKLPCYRLAITPVDPGSPYQRIKLWVRQDNFVPLKSEMYGKAGTLVKTLITQEIQRLRGRYFITRSTMTTHAEQRQTDLTLTRVDPRDDLLDDAFTVRALEKF